MRSERSAVLLSLALGAALAAVVALAGVTQQANAASPEKIVFESNRTAAQEGTELQEAALRAASFAGR